MFKSIIVLSAICLASNFAFASGDSEGGKLACGSMAQRAALALYSVENSAMSLDGIRTNTTGWVSAVTNSEVITVSFTNPEQEFEVKYEVTVQIDACSVESVKVQKAG